MKIINKLELTKEELETLEKAKQIIQNLNVYVRNSRKNMGIIVFPKFSSE